MSGSEKADNCPLFSACRECGATFERAPGTPRLVCEGTPNPRVAYPEDLYPGDPDIARVKRAALRCGRLWRTRGDDDGKTYREGA